MKAFSWIRAVEQGRHGDRTSEQNQRRTIDGSDERESKRKKHSSGFDKIGRISHKETGNFGWQQEGGGEESLVLQEEDQLLTMQLPLSLWYSTKRTMNTYVRLEKINIYLSSSMRQWRHRMSPADSNSSQEQVQRPLFSSLFLSNPLKKRFLCLQYSGGSEVEVSPGSQYVPTRISCVKNSPEQKLKFPPEPKLSFGV